MLRDAIATDATWQVIEITTYFSIALIARTFDFRITPEAHLSMAGRASPEQLLHRDQVYV